MRGAGESDNGVNVRRYTREEVEEIALHLRRHSIAGQRVREVETREEERPGEGRLIILTASLEHHGALPYEYPLTGEEERIGQEIVGASEGDRPWVRETMRGVFERLDREREEEQAPKRRPGRPPKARPLEEREGEA